ncbi:NADH-dependent flavin oxidoreductase [Phocicoccus pinnipedialis]|uniref:NADH oxidase n=1 Tax=Phocicoccus pinnipedialis TaxID=110845 RepID=A0A6V7R4U9_9BACL|nr:NADH-dependent flavin oxidoreductase [Jeotgalicoccus pinnipedialis]MBP1939988.1 fumarate reductase flavoprotein subunit [Jeotgalicoccus pinnipedialis]CAD2072064.1 NADH oxidase [Jeotgalicoccus pinnipedialis]
MTKQLFESVKLNKSGVTLKNRIVMAPMTTMSSFFDGSVTDELINYYGARAGEAAMIIVESTFIEDYGRAFDGSLGINKDTQIEGLAELAKAIKDKGSKAIIQLYHAGRMGKSTLNKGRKPIGASTVKALRDDAEEPEALTAEQVEEMIAHFGDAARRAMEAGFDGVEIHGANTYLIQQFFSPHSNTRDDEFGGDVEKRLTFGRRVIREIEAMKEKLGKHNFIVGYRFSPEELEKPGITFQDTMLMLNTFAHECIDYFHFSLNDYKRGSIIDTEDIECLIHKYHKNKSTALGEIPVIGSGGIWEKTDAEEALETGFDIVSVGKAHIVNPDWAEKIKNGDPIDRKIDGEREDYKIPRPFWNSVGFLKK